MEKFHSRKSIRLKGYDYSQSGMYFVTICTHKRMPLFGQIKNQQMVLNDYGRIAYNEWFRTAELRKNIILDEFIIMPNHIHGIIVIVDADDDGCGRGDLPVARDETPVARGSNIMNDPIINVGDRQVAPTGPAPKSIGAILAGFKSAVTTQINQLRHLPGEPVWQRNYHEHIIRNEKAFHHIANYIQNNPAKWNDDCFYG